MPAKGRPQQPRGSDERWQVPALEVQQLYSAPALLCAIPFPCDRDLGTIVTELVDPYHSYLFLTPASDPLALSTPTNFLRVGRMAALLRPLQPRSQTFGVRRSSPEHCPPYHLHGMGRGSAFTCPIERNPIGVKGRNLTNLGIPFCTYAICRWVNGASAARPVGRSSLDSDHVPEEAGFQPRFRGVEGDRGASSSVRRVHRRGRGDL